MNFKLVEKVPQELQKTAFVEIEVDRSPIVIKKSCLVWLFSDKGERVYTDRIYRFKKSAKDQSIEAEHYYAVIMKTNFILDGSLWWEMKSLR